MHHTNYMNHLWAAYCNQPVHRETAREKLMAIFASANVEVKAQPWRSHGETSESEVHLLVDGVVRAHCVAYAEPKYDCEQKTDVWYARIFGGTNEPNGEPVVVGAAEYDERDVAADKDNPRDHTRAKARKAAEQLAEKYLRAGFEKLRREFERAEALAAAKAASAELKAAEESVRQLQELLHVACAKRDEVLKAIEVELMQVTGNALCVGDVVRRALAPPSMTSPNAPRELGTMLGVIVRVIVDGGSGARRVQRNAVVVRWSSGSEARHDALMIVKVD